MCPSTGEIRTFAPGESIPENFIPIGNDLAPAVRRHQRRYVDAPVNLKSQSQLARFARAHRNGAHGKAKNRPR